MEDSRIIFLTDVNAVDIDDTCGMRYWYSSMEGGTGIQPKDAVLPNAILQETFKDLKTVSETKDLRRPIVQAAIDEILGALTDRDKADFGAMEVLYRRLGWLSAQAMFIEPTVRNLFDEVKIDSEIVLDRDPLWVAVKPGRVLRSRYEGEIIYREYVPANSLSSKWLEGWNYSPRLHIGMAAAQEELKMKIDYGQIVGLSKGYRQARNNKLVHPYVMGYNNEKTGEWTHSFMKAAGPDWKEKPVWEFPYGIVDWVAKCGAEVATQQFPTSAKVKFDAKSLNGWVNRRIHRERDLHKVKQTCHQNEHLRVIYYPKNTRECVPVAGEPCPYLTACWQQRTVSPLLTGDYVPNPSLVGTEEEVIVGEVIA